MLDPGMPSNIPNCDEFKSIGSLPKQTNMTLTKFEDLLNQARREGHVTSRDVDVYLDTAKEALSQNGEVKITLEFQKQPKIQIIYRQPAAK